MTRRTRGPDPSLLLLLCTRSRNLRDVRDLRFGAAFEELDPFEELGNVCTHDVPPSWAAIEPTDASARPEALG